MGMLHKWFVLFVLLFLFVGSVACANKKRCGGGECADDDGELVILDDEEDDDESDSEVIEDEDEEEVVEKDEEPDTEEDEGSPWPEDGKPYVDNEEIIISAASKPPRKVQFETGSAELLGDSEEILDEVSQLLKDQPDILKVEIQGHTDSVGGARKNLRLSRARAKVVRQRLIELGISSRRLTAKGYGLKKPLASNRTEEGREKNRRVEFKIRKRR